MVKKEISEIFDEQLGKEIMYEQILLKTRKKNHKYLIFVPLCTIVILLTTLTLTYQSQKIKEYNIYAYDDQAMKNELKNNVKIMLEQYDLASSINPGYPIFFELNDDFKQLDIEVKHGKILDYDRHSGIVKNIGTKLTIKKDQLLYFEVNEKTEIKISGKSDHTITKTISISIDENNHYYAILK